MEKSRYLLTVIVPTFNEVENISNFIRTIQEILKKTNFQILFVDDNSTDGTTEEIKKFSDLIPNVNLILRIGRRGLSEHVLKEFKIQNLLISQL